ncbi:hypothetical protein ACM66B_005291 [Microbotryomycetes sp. NB124-2]
MTLSWSAYDTTTDHGNSVVFRPDDSDDGYEDRFASPGADDSVNGAKNDLVASTSTLPIASTSQAAVTSLPAPVALAPAAPVVAPVAAPPKKRKRNPGPPPPSKTAEAAVRKSSRRHSGLFGNPDRPTYREPSSDEDEANESDGDPPFLASPYRHGPAQSLPSSPAKDDMPDTLRSSVARSTSGSVPPGDTSGNGNLLLNGDGKVVQHNYKAWSALEDIVFSNPKGFTSLVFQVASDLGMVVVVTDDRTSKLQSAYMHITCAYRRSGCPFILKLAKAREGGWVMRPQNPPPTNNPNDAKLARSNYKCIHPIKIDTSILPTAPLSTVSEAMPPKKKQKMGKQTNRPVPMRKAIPAPPPPSNAKQIVVSSMDVESPADDVYELSAGVQTGGGGGGRMSGKKVDSRILAPPFTRSLLLEQQVAPALSNGTVTQPPLARTGLRAPLARGAEQHSFSFGDVPAGHTVVVYRPAVLPPPNPPLPSLLQSKQSSTALADWKTYLSALHDDLKNVAEVLAHPTVAVSPQSFFSESEELRLAMVDMLEKDQLGLWPRMVLKAALKDRGEKVFKELVDSGKLSAKAHVEDVPLQPTEPEVHSLRDADKARAQESNSPAVNTTDYDDVQMDDLVSRSSSMRPSPEVDESDDGSFVPAQDQYTARLQALYSGLTPATTAEPVATTKEPQVEQEKATSPAIVTRRGARTDKPPGRARPSTERTFAGVEVPLSRTRQSTEESSSKAVAAPSPPKSAEAKVGGEGQADAVTAAAADTQTPDVKKAAEGKTLKVTLTNRSSDSQKSTNGSAENASASSPPATAAFPYSSSRVDASAVEAAKEQDKTAQEVATTTTNGDESKGSSTSLVPQLKASLLSRIRKAQASSPAKASPGKPVESDRRAMFAEFETTWLRGER